MTVGMIVAIKLLLLAVVVALGVNPHWRLSRFMWKSRGPRGDVECLSRRQLFAEGTKFLYLALIGFLILWLLQSLSDAWSPGVLEIPVVMGIFFITAVMMGMAVLAGTYMLVRGLFRSASYVPPAHRGGINAPHRGL